MLLYIQCDSDQDDEHSDVQNKKSGQQAAPTYKRLIAIHAGKAKNSLRHALETGIGKVSRVSLSEQAFEKAASSYGREIVKYSMKSPFSILNSFISVLFCHPPLPLPLFNSSFNSRFTQKNILRVYPKGTRVNSSNFKPLAAWMHGAQMVAFNMQV